MNEKVKFTGSMMTGQEQKLCGGTMMDTDEFWHIPQCIFEGRHPIAYVAAARMADGPIITNIRQVMADGTPMHIYVSVPLAELDPQTGITLDDPRVSGVEETWSPCGEFTVVETLENLTKKLYETWGGAAAFHLRAAQPEN